MTETESVSPSAAGAVAGPDPDAVARARAVADSAVLVPMLPCGDIDEMADFWTGLGLAVTYRQRRPNPYVALELGGIALHYYGMPRWDPEQSHSTCVVAVPDTEPVYDLFAAGLRERFGRLPLTGFPRITRPRRRANNAGLSGFSLIDPAGNWVRFTHLPPSGAGAGSDTGAGTDSATDAGADTDRAAADGDVAPWSATPGGGPVARALDSAVVLADSHGDPAQARKILAGALRRAGGSDADVPVAELAPALAYLVELCVRTGDPDTARSAHERLADLAAADLAPADRNVADVALTESRAVLPGP